MRNSNKVYAGAVVAIEGDEITSSTLLAHPQKNACVKKMPGLHSNQLGTLQVK